MGELLLDNILCYLSSARNSLTFDRIISNAMAFYKIEMIVKSKKTLAEILGVEYQERRSSKNTSAPQAHLEDIMSMLDDASGNTNSVLPTFVANGYDSMPPSAGFEAVASVMCDLRDEVSAMRLQYDELKKKSEIDFKSLENVSTVIQDVSEIKKMLVDLKSERPNITVPEIHTEEVDSVNSAKVVSPNPIDKNLQPTELDSISDGSSENNPSQSYASMIVSNSNLGGGRTDAPWIKVVNNRNNRNRKSNVASSMNRNQEKNGNSLQPKYRRKNITGTRAQDSSLKAVPRILDVFVGGCGLDTTDSTITDYCQTQQAQILKCEPLESKSEWYKCYKISVAADNRDVLLDANFWPQGIFVGKYYKPRPKADF